MPLINILTCMSTPLTTLSIILFAEPGYQETAQYQQTIKNSCTWPVRIHHDFVVTFMAMFRSIIQSTKRHYEQLVAEQSCKQVHRPIAKKNNGPHRKHSPRELFGEGVHSFFNFKQVLEKFNNKDNNRTAILSHSKPIV